MVFSCPDLPAEPDALARPHGDDAGEVVRAFAVFDDGQVRLPGIGDGLLRQLFHHLRVPAVLAEIDQRVVLDARKHGRFKVPVQGFERFGVGRLLLGAICHSCRSFLRVMKRRRA